MDFFNFLYRKQNKALQSDFNEEYASEVSVDTNETDLSDSYSANGVFLGNVVNTCKIKYNGILAANDTQEVTAVINFGDNSNWDNINYYPMRKVGDQSYELYFPLKNSTNLNLAFKDSNDNWDNNAGQNYTFTEGSY